MSSDSSFPRRVTEYEFDGENRLLEVRQITKADGSVETEHIWGPEPEPPFLHVRARRRGRAYHRDMARRQDRTVRR